MIEVDFKVHTTHRMIFTFTRTIKPDEFSMSEKEDFALEDRVLCWFERNTRNSGTAGIMTKFYVPSTNIHYVEVIDIRDLTKGTKSPAAEKSANAIPTSNDIIGGK